MTQITINVDVLLGAFVLVVEADSELLRLFFHLN